MLDTENKDQLKYEADGVIFYLLGGVQLKGLDRMRVTLKVEKENKSLRHNLDLYNDSQVERMTRRIAEKLELNTRLIEENFDTLINELENYRLEKLSEEETLIAKETTLTKKEIEEAENFLKEKNLIERTRETIKNSGVIGEELNSLRLYLIYMSRKMDAPLQAINVGSSGTGKTYLQTKIGELMPEEDTLSLTFLSENSFYYFGKEELKNKLILIEDLDGAESVLYPLRELQTKKRITKTIVSKRSNGETRTSQLIVEGPVCVSGCTTKETIYEDNANRSFVLYLDESKDQDNLIMEYQRKLASGKVNKVEEEKNQKRLKNCQRILKPVKVRNPYAEPLLIPIEVLKPRRTNAHYLAFIEAVTFYKQYQRKLKTDRKRKEKYIETEIEDIREANELLKDILLRKSDELSLGVRKYLESIKNYLKEEDKTTYKNAEIRKKVRVNPSVQKYYTKILTNYGYLLKTGIKERGYVYSLTTEEEYEELKKKVESALESIMTKISR